MDGFDARRWSADGRPAKTGTSYPVVLHRSATSRRLPPVAERLRVLPPPRRCYSLGARRKGQPGTGEAYEVASELIQQFTGEVRDGDGRLYTAEVHGARRDDVTWEGWIEFRRRAGMR